MVGRKMGTRFVRSIFLSLIFLPNRLSALFLGYQILFTRRGEAIEKRQEFLPFRRRQYDEESDRCGRLAGMGLNCFGAGRGAAVVKIRAGIGDAPEWRRPP